MMKVEDRSKQGWHPPLARRAGPLILVPVWRGVLDFDVSKEWGAPFTLGRYAEISTAPVRRVHRTHGRGIRHRQQPHGVCAQEYYATALVRSHRVAPRHQPPILREQPARMSRLRSLPVSSGRQAALELPNGPASRLTWSTCCIPPIWYLVHLRIELLT